MRYKSQWLGHETTKADCIKNCQGMSCKSQRPRREIEEKKKILYFLEHFFVVLRRANRNREIVPSSF